MVTAVDWFKQARAIAAGRTGKPWRWVAGAQPVDQTGLPWEIYRAVLRKIANRPYTLRQRLESALQNQADVLPSKSS